MHPGSTLTSTLYLHTPRTHTRTHAHILLYRSLCLLSISFNHKVNTYQLSLVYTTNTQHTIHAAEILRQVLLINIKDKHLNFFLLKTATTKSDTSVCWYEPKNKTEAYMIHLDKIITTDTVLCVLEAQTHRSIFQDDISTFLCY